MSSNEQIKKWSELLKENREKILDEMVEAYRCAEGGMSGWHTGVEMDQDGQVWHTGIISQGSQSMSSWEGTTYAVANIQTWNGDYQTDELKDAEELKNQYAEFEELCEAAEENDECCEYDFFYDFMSDRYPDLLREAEQRLIKENIEVEIEFYRDQASDHLNWEITQAEERENCEIAQTKEQEIYQ